MACLENRVCESYSEQTEWDSPLNSLRASRSEMSLSASNMWWHCAKTQSQHIQLRISFQWTVTVVSDLFTTLYVSMNVVTAAGVQKVKTR